MNRPTYYSNALGLSSRKSYVWLNTAFWFLCLHNAFSTTQPATTVTTDFMTGSPIVTSTDLDSTTKNSNEDSLSSISTPDTQTWNTSSMNATHQSSALTSTIDIVSTTIFSTSLSNAASLTNSSTIDTVSTTIFSTSLSNAASLTNSSTSSNPNTATTTTVTITTTTTTTAAAMSETYNNQSTTDYSISTFGSFNSTSNSNEERNIYIIVSVICGVVVVSVVIVLLAVCIRHRIRQCKEKTKLEKEDKSGDTHVNQTGRADKRDPVANSDKHRAVANISFQESGTHLGLLQKSLNSDLETNRIFQNRDTLAQKEENTDRLCQKRRQKLEIMKIEDEDQNHTSTFLCLKFKKKTRAASHNIQSAESSRPTLLRNGKLSQHNPDRVKVIEDNEEPYYVNVIQSPRKNVPDPSKSKTPATRGSYFTGVTEAEVNYRVRDKKNKFKPKYLTSPSLSTEDKEEMEQNDEDNVIVINTLYESSDDLFGLAASRENDDEKEEMVMTDNVLYVSHEAQD